MCFNVSQDTMAPFCYAGCIYTPCVGIHVRIHVYTKWSKLIAPWKFMIEEDSFNRNARMTHRSVEEVEHCRELQISWGTRVIWFTTSITLVFPGQQSCTNFELLSTLDMNSTYCIYITHEFQSHGEVPCNVLAMTVYFPVHFKSISLRDFSEQFSVILW